MIRVCVRSKSIKIAGHASEYHRANGNLVCAAVSALTWNLINCLEALAGDKVSSNVSDGNVSIEWEKLSDKGKLLVDSWYQGILAVKQEYNCIEIC